MIGGISTALQPSNVLLFRLPNAVTFNTSSTVSDYIWKYSKKKSYSKSYVKGIATKLIVDVLG